MGGKATGERVGVGHARKLCVLPLLAESVRTAFG
jgi:hypothetical protein